MGASIVFKLLGFLGGDMFTRILESVMGYFTQRANDDLARFQTGVQADTQIALAHVNAELESRKLQERIIEADRGWWVTAWIRPLLVYPCIIHFAAIVLDSTPFWSPLGAHVVGSWEVAKLPPPYDLYEQAIILSYFIARPFEKVARVFTAGRK